MFEGRPYILMESAPGINVWRQSFRPQKSTEQQLFEAMLFVATGADSVMYFQWRKGRGGAEKYHGAIVDHLGTSEHRVFQSVKRVGEMLKKMDGVVGTGIDSKIAITFDYETLWALNGSIEAFEKLGGRTANGYLETQKAIFNALWKQNIPADIIGYDNDFDKYQIVFLPSPYIMTDALAEKIKTYVKNGGTVVTFYLTAMVNENDLTYVGGMPGCGLRELFGVRVDETSDYSSTDCGIVNTVRYNGKSYPLSAHADITTLEGAEMLGVYEGDFFRGASALSKKRYGKGAAYHVAFYPDDSFAYDFTRDLCDELGIRAPQAVTAEESVRVVCREGDGEKYYFVLNCSDTERSVELAKPLRDLLDGTTVSGKVTLAPLGYLILKEET